MRDVHSRMSILLLVPLLAGWLVLLPAKAYELPKMSLEEQVAHSDFIAVARVAEPGPIDAEHGVHGSVSLAVEDVVKGDMPSGQVVFITKGHLVEMDPDCCEASSRYLIFAKRREDGLYYASNGPLSTFRIEDESVLKWPDGMADEPCTLPAVIEIINRVEESGSDAGAK